MEAADADRWVEGLRAFAVSELGGAAFTAQHARVEELNVLAHRAAAASSDNFVLASLLAHERLPALLRTLLACEAWRERVLPELLPLVAAQAAAPGEAARAAQGVCMRAYFVLHHESVVANLLECVLFHDYAAQALGDGVVDLIDYCARQVARLVFERDPGRLRARAICSSHTSDR